MLGLVQLRKLWKLVGTTTVIFLVFTVLMQMVGLPVAQAKKRNTAAMGISVKYSAYNPNASKSSSSSSSKSSSSSGTTSSKSSGSSSKSSTSSSQKSLTDQLAQCKLDYENAKSRGDKAAMEAAHQKAEQLRAQGASESEANKKVYGNEKGWYSGWSANSSSSSRSSSNSSDSSSGKGYSLADQMRDRIAQQGLSAFSDYSAIEQLKQTDPKVYNSLKTVAGTLIVGFGEDQAARMNETVSKGSMAQILARNFGIETNDPDGKGLDAMAKLGFSGSNTDPVDAKELSNIIKNLTQTYGTGKYDLQIVHDALSGKLNDSNITRGEAITLYEPHDSGSHGGGSSSHSSPPASSPSQPTNAPQLTNTLPPTSTPTPAPVSTPTHTPTPAPIPAPVYIPPDVRGISAKLDSNFAIPGLPLGVFVDLTNSSLRMNSLKVVTSMGMEVPMKSDDGIHFKGQVMVLQSFKIPRLEVQVTADVSQPPYYPAKRFVQTLVVPVKTSTTDMEKPVPEDTSAPDWWTPPWYGGSQW